MAGDRRASARGRDQTHEHADRRRLPGAVRSEEGEQLPFGHGEGDVLDGDVAVERACQSFDGNHETILRAKPARVSVVEPDGKLRMILSNHPRSTGTKKCHRDEDVGS